MLTRALAARRGHGGESGLLYADEVLCRRWTVLIVASLADGPLRFSALQDELRTISARTLTSRLRELEEIDLVDRVAVNHGSGAFGYQLTRHGRRLLRVIDEMRRLTPGLLPPRPWRATPPQDSPARHVLPIDRQEPR